MFSSWLPPSRKEIFAAQDSVDGKAQVSARLFRVRSEVKEADNMEVGQFELSSRASLFSAARDLGEPRDAARYLRRNDRAFGSLPY
jgi:hypothetical protein